MSHDYRSDLSSRIAKIKARYGDEELAGCVGGLTSLRPVDDLDVFP